uniref:Uncharacterized protein n=1 Tax=Oryza punctata TaxID=4537 RepID=A0A0E0KQT2_ORYPU
MANNQIPPSLILYFSLFPSPHLCPLSTPSLRLRLRSAAAPRDPESPPTSRAAASFLAPRAEGFEVGETTRPGSSVPPASISVVGESGGEAVCPCRSPGMDKLVQFGRKAWFVVRVLSGYEERRIRAHRLQMQQRIARAQAKKEELRKQPEQIILSEVRQMVQQMQSLNQQLEEAETAIDEYFKPIDKNAKIIMDMQLEKEEKQIKEMTKVMQDQIAMQREIASKRAQAIAMESKDTQTQTSDKIAEGPPKEETMK